MYWDLHHLWGQGARGQHGSKLKLAPLTPRSLPLLPPCSSLLPAHSQLAPAPSSLHLAPACSQLTPSSLPAHSSLLPARSNLLPMAMYVLGSPPPVGCKGLWGKVGASWSELGASWSEPSERNVILGFRAPTTSGRKTSIMTYSAYVSPPPGSKIPTQCPFT